MWIITRAALVKFCERNPQARPGLQSWHKAAKMARWTCLQDVRTMFPHADAVIVASGKPVVVFNIAGNKYRLITAIHYNTQKIFTLFLLTHAEYSREKWKDAL